MLQLSPTAQKFCLATFGFIPDPYCSFRGNVQNGHHHMSADSFFYQFYNLAFHSFCINLLPPPGLQTLLGLGMKFCIQQSHHFPHCKTSIHWFHQSIYLKVWLQNNFVTTTLYIPKLYIPSPWEPPPDRHGTYDLQALNFTQRYETTLISDASPTQPARFNLSKGQ